MDINKIQNFIDEDINPFLRAHGGFITIREFDESLMSLKIEMGGGCQGCASSNITLKHGIQNCLKEEFPDLKSVEDVTDHSQGENPYYEKE